MTDHSELRRLAEAATPGPWRGLRNAGNPARILALLDEVEALKREQDEALKYATQLATSLANKHWPEIPQWKPLPDLYGVISQIDNMSTGMTRKGPTHD
jgi:hypothetical protein